MNLTSILPQKLTRACGKLWLKTKKASPEICVIGGIVCGAGALVLVGVQTWKNKDILTQDANNIKALKAAAYETLDLENREDVEVECVKDGRKTKVSCPTIAKKEPTKEELEALWKGRLAFAIDIGKAYWLPIALEVGSMVLIWKGRTILRKDLSAMTALYAGAVKKYMDYRKKVAEKIGAEEEQKLAFGYSTEDVVDENGNVETRIKPEQNGNRNPFGTWWNEGDYTEDNKELIWRNFVWKEDKKEDLWRIKEEQETATRDLRTIGYWRYGDSLKRLGYSPKFYNKFHHIGKVYVEGGENKVDFGVLEGPRQLPCNRGFTDSFCSQNICYINPNIEGDGYIGYIDDEIEKYDFRFAKDAPYEIPYKSYFREANRLIEQYNKEKLEQRIFNGMSDKAQRKWAKILK